VQLNIHQFGLIKITNLLKYDDLSISKTNCSLSSCSRRSLWSNTNIIHESGRSIDVARSSSFSNNIYHVDTSIHDRQIYRRWIYLSRRRQKWDPLGQRNTAKEVLILIQNKQREHFFNISWVIKHSNRIKIWILHVKMYVINSYIYLHFHQSHLDKYKKILSIMKHWLDLVKWNIEWKVLYLKTLRMFKSHRNKNAFNLHTMYKMLCFFKHNSGFTIEHFVHNSNPIIA